MNLKEKLNKLREENRANHNAEFPEPTGELVLTNAGAHLVDGDPVIIEHVVTQDDVDSDPAAELVVGETIGIPVEKPKRSRRKKADPIVVSTGIAGITSEIREVSMDESSEEE